ncbi:MAG: efflux RND transporter periplasmic adaptor subunit [Aquabacterium sp.]
MYAVAAVLGWTMAACTPKPVVDEPIRSVRTQVVQVTDVAAGQQFAAEIKARSESRLSFRVPGKVIARQVDVGQPVRKGQVLAQLDARDLRLAEQAAQAGLSSARASLEQAEAEFKRFKDLREQGFISAWDLDRREAALKVARAQTAQVIAQADVQGNQTGYAQLVADGAGVVVAVDAEPGMVVSAGMPVIRVAHDGPRDAVFAVPEHQVSAIRALTGRAGALQLSVWGDATTRWPATVREVAPAADASTRTFLVKADLGAAPVRIGQSASIALKAVPKPAIRLPLAAIFEHQGKPAVWLFDGATSTVRTASIEVAGAEANDAIVASGVRQGDVVVTAGVHVLSPGQKVRRQADATGASTAPGRTAPAAAAGASR